MIIGHSKNQDITFLSFHDASLIHIVAISRGDILNHRQCQSFKESLICSVKSPSGRLKSIALHFTVWTFGFLRKNPVAQFWPMGRSSPELAAMCWANSLSWPSVGARPRVRWDMTQLARCSSSAGLRRWRCDCALYFGPMPSRRCRRVEYGIPQALAAALTFFVASAWSIACLT